MKKMTKITSIFMFIALSAFGQKFGYKADDAINKAQQNNKSIAILYRGSNWMVAGEMFKDKIWKNLEFRKNFSDLIFYDIDYLENEKDKNKEVNENWKGLKPGIDAYPALAIFDEKGRILILQNNIALETDLDLKKSIEFVKDVLAIKKNRDASFAKAETLSGVEKVQELGATLDKLSKVIKGNLLNENYKEEFETIKKLDSENKSGYFRRFNLNIGEIRNKVSKLTSDKNYSEAEKIIKSEIYNAGNKALNPSQIQELYLIAHNLYKAANNNEERWKILREAIKIDPESHLGLGFRGMLSMNGEGEVGFNYGWYPKDFSGNSFKWEIEMGCKKLFSRIANYEITFAINDKDTKKIIFQNLELKFDGKVIKPTPVSGEISNENKTCTFNFALPIKPIGKIILSVSGIGENLQNSRGSISGKPIVEIN